MSDDTAMRVAFWTSVTHWAILSIIPCMLFAAWIIGLIRRRLNRRDWQAIQKILEGEKEHTS